jgi:hypothetical protein
MRETDLPSPDIGGKGHILRRLVSNAINSLAVSAPHYTTGAHPKAASLAAFLTAAAVKAAYQGLINPVLSFTPTAKTYSIATGATAGPTLGKGGSTGAATYTSSNPTKATVNSTTGAVTGLVAGTVTITVVVAADATYRDATSSYVATITA